MWRSSPAKSSTKRRRVVAAAQRQRGEEEPGDPALGALVQSRDRRLVELERVQVVEQHLGLAGREAQRVGVELQEVSTRAQARDRQRRLRARGDRERQRRRPEVEDELDRAVDLRVLDRVVVVEHEHALGQPAQLVDEHRQRLVDEVDAGRQQHRQRARADVGVERAQRLDQVEQEVQRVVVARRRARATRTAAAPRSHADQSESSADLPQPAGARTSTSRRGDPASSASSGTRGTCSRRTGAWSLVHTRRGGCARTSVLTGPRRPYRHFTRVKSQPGDDARTLLEEDAQRDRHRPVAFRAWKRG